MIVNTPVSVGELVDKITILKIKKLKIKDDEKLKKIDLELNLLESVYNFTVPDSVIEAEQSLYQVNLELWDVEDSLRECERNKTFDSNFVELARKVYHLNDERFRLKNLINNSLGSHVQEVKSYSEY